VRIPLELGAGTDALRAGDESSTVQAALMIALMGVCVIAVRTASRALVFTPGRYIEYDLRNQIMAQVFRLRTWDLSERGAGDLVSRAANDISLTRALVGYGTLQVVNIFSALTLTVWRMLQLDTRLTLITLLPIAIAGLGTTWAIRTLFPLTRRLQVQLAGISNFVLASFRGIDTIQAYGAAPAFQRRLDQVNGEYLASIMRIVRLSSGVQPILAFSSALALYLLLVQGGGMAAAGEISIGDLVALSAYLVVLIPYLRMLGWLVAIVQRGRASLERVFDILDLQPTRPDLKDPAPDPSPGPLGYRLAGLDFAYPQKPDVGVLRRLRAHIPAGRLVGIFGRTGSGKSTLLQLLARLHDPPRGQLSLLSQDGEETDLARVNLEHLRSRISYVPQLPFLFTASVEKNIALGRSMSRDQALHAASAAGLDPDLERLPQAADTLVGERGVILSGGQRQRVALARALGRRADVLLLDDVLASVDHATERHLVRSILELARPPGGTPSTVVFVTSRLGALASADWVLVLDKGRLADQGRPQDLLQRQGPYRDAWLVQQGQGEEP